ncbi:hypothetical protein KCP71_21465 [Salmonella enterica subsp. enterica]|nr:hypothetical protein KCP71_21465 [Salmonella enterica subsp. enterica]
MLTYATTPNCMCRFPHCIWISCHAGGAKLCAPLHNRAATPVARPAESGGKVRDVAAELLDIYAQRAAKEGFAF